MTDPYFTPEFTALCRASIDEALVRQGMEPMPLVKPIAVTVHQMDEDRLAVLLRPGAPLSADEWAFVEGNG